MASPVYHLRLARLAAPLEPDVAPYYVNSVRPGHAGFGWYFVPRGIGHPVFLGVNHTLAEIKLHELVGRAA